MGPSESRPERSVSSTSSSSRPSIQGAESSMTIADWSSLDAERLTIRDSRLDRIAVNEATDMLRKEKAKDASGQPTTILR